MFGFGPGFNFYTGDEQSLCQECSAPITREQCQVSRFCESCQDQNNAIIQSRIPGWIDARVAQECYAGWEEDFLLKLNAEEEKRKRLR